MAQPSSSPLAGRLGNAGTWLFRGSDKEEKTPTTVKGKGSQASRKSEEAKDPQNDDIDTNPDFKMLLHQIQRAESFEELKELCTSIELPPLELDEDLDICWKDFQFDAIAEGLLPADTKNTRYRALKTGADGNCLYRSASIFAFGDEGQHEEMRLRTLLELALNSRFYQEGEDIKEILLAEERQMHPNIGKSSAKLSDEQALETVLNRKIRSVFPDSGGNEIKKYFNAIIRPRQYDPSKEPLAFMWTHTKGGDASKFTPNHFVPLIPVSKILAGKPIFQESEQTKEFSSGLKGVKEVDLVADIIYGDPSVLDEVCLKLDYPVGKLPCKYWPHLAHNLGAKELTRMRFQQKSGYTPSVRMFAYLSATSPDLSVDKLKSNLRSIERDDLVSMLEEGSVKGSERLTALSQREPKTFHEICLRLDCGGVYNWQDIGEAIGISVDTLEKCERPGEYTDVALQIIHSRRPRLSVGEIKETIKKMDRGDVLEHLNVLPDNSTIQALLNNYEVLQEVTRLLDKETPETKNWKDFAQKFGLTKAECDYLCPVEYHSSTTKLMEYLSCAKPKLTIHSFIDALRKIDRMDVVEESLKKFFNHIDIDVIVNNIKLRQLSSGQTNE
ncbi:uncharacterized protein [Porites lutea]|uniref:uncharacterized protein n=1 Tax=Porites lutea TaxID=51062 RepID=UPI003CC520B0